jgi:TPR repeat protein
MYENGEGIVGDINQAIYWHRKSAEQGDQDARDKLEELFPNDESVDRKDRKDRKRVRKYYDDNIQKNNNKHRKYHHCKAINSSIKS